MVEVQLLLNQCRRDHAKNYELASGPPFVTSFIFPAMLNFLNDPLFWKLGFILRFYS